MPLPSWTSLGDIPVLSLFVLNCFLKYFGYLDFTFLFDEARDCCRWTLPQERHWWNFTA